MKFGNDFERIVDVKFEGNVLIFEAGFAGRNDTTKNDDYNHCNDGDAGDFDDGRFKKIHLRRFGRTDLSRDLFKIFFVIHDIIISCMRRRRRLNLGWRLKMS